MRLRMLVVLMLVALVASSRADQPGSLPVDEAAIIAEIEALIDASPDLDEKKRETVRRLAQKGIKAHDAKQFDRAIQLYQEALAIGPLTDTVYYELAYTYTTVGEQVKALDALIRALTLNPKREIYHVLKASVLDDLGFRDEAVEAYQELLEIQPDSYLGHLNLGITLSRSGEMEQAEEAFLRAIEIDPGHPSGYFQIALLCDTLDYNYDERKYLERFLEVGSQDHRLQRVKDRLEELQRYEVVVDPHHPYPDLEVVEKMTRVAWETELHKNTFPDARGYELTFEEDKDTYATLLPMWRKKKEQDPEAAYGPYDLLLRIDDAGFLDEYIWYHRQRVFGNRAIEWMGSHEDRVEAFLDWARSEGLLSDEQPQPANVSPLDRFRVLPADLFDVVERSEVLYEVGAETGRPTGLLQDERDRFSSDLKLNGKDRVSCGRASGILDEEIPKSGARALVPMFRCFVPGQPGYEKGVQRAASLGLEAREIEFLPVADLILGEQIQLNGEASWLLYALAKAAWRKEPQLRERYGGSESVSRASLAEEVFALSVAAGAYANALEPVAPQEAVGEPPEPIPALDRLLEAIRADHFRGYLLYEVVHKAYRLPLDRLDERDAEQVTDYLFGHVIFRTQAKSESRE